jgi:hypothetical protein
MFVCGKLIPAALLHNNSTLIYDLLSEIYTKPY